MRTQTVLLALFFFVCIPLYAQQSPQQFLRNKIFADLSISTTEGSLQAAVGYKFSEHFGLGLGWNQLERYKPLIGITLRGTNMQDDLDKLGLFYTAGWWHTMRSVGNFQSQSLFEMGVGIRYKDLALTVGYGRRVEHRWQQAGTGARRLVDYVYDTPQLKFSYLFNTYRGERPFLRKMFRWDGGKSYPAFAFDFALGRTFLQSWGVDFGGSVTEVNFLELSLARQLTPYSGVGLSLHSTFSASPGARYNLTSIGFCFRGEPGLLYYRATLAAVTSFSREDDWGEPVEEFDRTSGFDPVFQLNAGVRLFQRLSLGGGFQWVSGVQGTHRIYDRNDFFNPILLVEENRKVSLTIWQVMLGLSF